VAPTLGRPPRAASPNPRTPSSISDADGSLSPLAVERHLHVVDLVAFSIATADWHVARIEEDPGTYRLGGQHVTPVP
jgi:hypothetical protein